MEWVWCKILLLFFKSTLLHLALNVRLTLLVFSAASKRILFISDLEMELIKCSFGA